MHIELPPDDRRPTYLRIADAIRAAIARGDLVAGEPLPALRSLAPQLGVNPNTVLQAYGELARSHVVEARRGSGTFVRAAVFGDAERRVLAEAVAARALRDAHTHGLTDADLAAALARLEARHQHPTR